MLLGAITGSTDVQAFVVHNALAVTIGCQERDRIYLTVMVALRLLFFGKVCSNDLVYRAQDVSFR